MKTKLTRYWKPLLTVFFGLSAFLFWVFPFLPMLSFQEQYQLFLFDTGYFVERISVPGGLTDWLGEFLVQFYYVYVAGALLLALLLVVLQRLFWQLLRRGGAADAWYAASFVLPLLLWWYMSDENVLVGFPVALSAAMLAMLGYEKASRSMSFSRCGKPARAALLLLGLPVFYWLFGPVSLTVALYVLFLEVSRRHVSGSVAFGAATVVYAVAVVLVCSHFLSYPLYRLFCGLGYYRSPALVPPMQLVLILIPAVLPFLAVRFPTLRRSWAVPVSVAAVAVTGFLLIVTAFRGVKFDIIEYDFLVRTNAWDGILRKAASRPPSTPFEVACVNLALSKKGQLGDRLFEFYQNGSEGLFPTFARDMTTPLPAAEVFFHLGMVNEALRYTFEAQEAIPDFRKSGRLTKRLVQCEIVNGHYAVAEKYLRRLQKSLFYARWADEQMVLLHNEQAINAHPLYGRLRRYRYTRDFLFSDREMDQMLGLLYTHCYDNRQAFEYLMAYELVQRDMERFMKYYPIGRYAGYSDHIPYAFQQALVLGWTQTHSSFEGMPWGIDPAVRQGMSTFIGTYMHDKNAPSLHEGPLANTFWSYMLVNKDKAQATKKEMKQIY